MAILSGLKGAFPQPGTWGRNESGNYSLVSFEGSKQEVKLLAYAYAQIPGLLYEVKEQFGKSRIDVRFPWNVQGIDPRTDFIDNWELFANTVEADILSTAIPSGILDTLSAEQIAKIRFLLSQPPDPGDEANYPAVGDFTLDGDGTSGAKAYTVWTRMKKGVLNFPVEAPILRHSITTSLAYAIPASLIHVRQLLTTNSLYQLEGAPLNYLFNLPVDAPPADAALTYAWRKVFPTIQQVALLKWQIVQEYHYGLWDTTFWPLPI